jgi:hypothetical protein
MGWWLKRSGDKCITVMLCGFIVCRCACVIVRLRVRIDESVSERDQCEINASVSFILDWVNQINCSCRSR